MLRWLAVLVLGFVIGAAAILLADPGTTNQVLVAPAGASSGGPTELNGQHVHGVKAGDVAAESQPDQPLDPATRARAAVPVSATPGTVRCATRRSRMRRRGAVQLAGGFAPGSGAHYVSYGSGLSGPGAVDVEHPEALIYDGTAPTSQIVGLMYYSISPTQPEGFAGPNDHWHRHSNVCVSYSAGGINVPYPADADVTKAQCDSAGGNLMQITGWMVHAWVVPSYESPQGVFSHDNPDVRCADGTYQTDKAGFCQGT